MAFHDGLGERRTVPDAGGEVDHLRIRQELSGVPSFEFALRERVGRLAQFRHPAFARVRSVERGTGSEQTLVVVSDHVQGTRLSDLIALAESKRAPIETGAVLCLLRQLVPALAILHENARDAAHGAIAPERLIVTPTARLVVADYALGSALEQLLYSRDRYWTELRVALPRGAGLARLDQQSDVMQIGMVALSLVLGRRLKDDDQGARVGDLLLSAKALNESGGAEPLPDAFRQWLQRALHLDPRAAFPSAVEARLAFDRVLDESNYDASPSRLDTVVARLRSDDPAAPVTEPARPARAAIFDFKPAADARAAAAVAPTMERGPMPVSIGATAAASAAAVSVAPAPIELPPIVAREDASARPTRMFSTSAPDTDEAPVAHEFAPERVRGRSRSMLMAGAFVAIAAVGVVATMAWPKKPAPVVVPPVTTGTLAITTDPPGAQASVDGATQGVTPITLTLAAGTHTLVVRGEFGERTVPVTVGAGAQVAQYLDLPKADVPPVVATPVVTAPVMPAAAADAPLAGWVSVASRFDVQLFEEGRLLGSSQSDRIMVGAGKHEIDLVNEELGYRGKRTVQVSAGKVASVSIDAPKGTIALNALPWAEVVIDGEKAGETPLGNVSLPIGEHDVVFRHPELGEQRYRVAVTLKGAARLSADLRTK